MVLRTLFLWFGIAELDQWILQEETSAALVVQRVENATALQESDADRINAHALPEIFVRDMRIRLGRFATRERLRRRRSLGISAQPKTAASA